MADTSDNVRWEHQLRNCEYGWRANLHPMVEAFRSITVHLSTILV